MESTEFITQGMQSTTRRGRSTAGLMDYSMFPGKYELTDMDEDADSIYNDRRDTLRDRTPDTNSLFAADEPRRNTDRTRLQMTEYGSRYRYDPFFHPDSDVNLSHTDKDPRGASGETNWAEFRRVAENKLRNIDLKPDRDPMQEADGIHPNELYAKIRATQNLLKMRWKNFRESFDGMSNGGVGTYDNVSGVYKSAINDSLTINDGEDGPGSVEKTLVQRDFVDRLSNVLHLGGALRTDSTTDHRVNISSYGKLYANMGLQPVESALRSLEDDTIMAPGRMRENLVKKQLVSTAAAEVKRVMEQMSGDESKFARSTESQGTNKNIVISNILNLMGFSDQEINTIYQATRSRDQTVRKQALYDAQNIMDMIETMEVLPIDRLKELQTVTMRSIMLPDTDLMATRSESVVTINPKILSAMETALNTVRSADPSRVNGSEIREAIAYEQQIVSTQPLYSRKSMAPSDVRDTRNLSSVTQAYKKSTKAKNYGVIVPTRKYNAGYATAEWFRASVDARQRSRAPISASDVVAALNKASYSMAVGDNLSVRRGGGIQHHASNVKSVQGTTMIVDAMNDLENR